MALTSFIPKFGNWFEGIRSISYQVYKPEYANANIDFTLFGLPIFFAITYVILFSYNVLSKIKRKIYLYIILFFELITITLAIIYPAYMGVMLGFEGCVISIILIMIGLTYTSCKTSKKFFVIFGVISLIMHTMVMCFGIWYLWVVEIFVRYKITDNITTCTIFGALMYLIFMFTAIKKHANKNFIVGIKGMLVRR